MKRYLADTNILSEILKKRPNPQVVERLSLLGPTAIYASEITLMELRFGTALHPEGAALWRKIEASILPLATWLDFNRAASIATADLLATLRRSGSPVGPWDTCLAGTALAHQLIMVTRNTSHFERIPGLNVENWFDP